MKCAECGIEVPANTKYCSNCGTPVQPPPGIESHPAAPTAAMTMPSSSALAGWLVVESGADEGQQFQLRGTMRIGRTKDNEIVLDDSETSRHHAAISQEASGYSLQDLNSTNGTFLNEQRITNPQSLKDGDHIRIGNTRLLFGWQPSTTSAPAPLPQEAQPTMAAPSQHPPAGPQVVPVQPFSPQTQDTLPPKPRSTKRSGRVPAVAVVLFAVLAILLCAIVAVSLYLVLGRSSSDQPALPGSPIPPVITQVVTDSPAPVVTMVITNSPEPTPAPLSTETPIPGPVTVRVVPNGRGDYASLEMAVEAVPSGSTILLDPGTYQLAGSLEIDESLSFQDAGMDQTFVAGTEGDQLVLFAGPGSFAAQSTTFRY